MALRVVAALAVLVSAAVHLILYFDGMSNTDVGVPFMLNAVGGVVIAGLLVLWDHWVPAFLALGFGVSTLGAFILSTTVGLLGVHEQWVGGYVWTAAISEAVAIVCGGLLLLRANPLRSARQGQHGEPVGSSHLHR
ncbi:MAG: hypothetical protein HOQ22_10775 [Nocardioidaceae bacterium]|nr:hypothetical protein [Nocardioidaceae bacterium]NUS51509.1 hypothetical protein [Nocardioidaceae bacterium]